MTHSPPVAVYLIGLLPMEWGFSALRLRPQRNSTLRRGKSKSDDNIATRHDPTRPELPPANLSASQRAIPTPHHPPIRPHHNLKPTTIMTSTIGIPIKLLNEAQVRFPGHPIPSNA